MLTKSNSKIRLFILILVLAIPACGFNSTKQSFNYTVRVQSKETGENVVNASISIFVAGKPPLTLVTDDTGFAITPIDAGRVEQLGNLVIEAKGYKKYSQNITLIPDTLPIVIQLATLASNQESSGQTAIQATNAPPTSSPTTTPTPLPTSTLTDIPSTATPTDTPKPTPTFTITPTPLPPTDTPTPTPTFTITPTPLPPTLTPTPTPTDLPTSTPTPTLDTRLKVGDSYTEKGIKLTLESPKFEVINNLGFMYIFLNLQNQTGDTITFNWTKGNLSLVDNLGQEYGTACTVNSQIVLKAGESSYIACFNGDDLIFYANQMFNQEVTDLTFTVKKLSRVSQAQWSIKLPH